MKRVVFVLAIALLAIGAVSAQTVTVEGTLQLQNGKIAVATGNTFYFVPVLNQYIGFIEGLKEGARVSVLGFASGNIIQASQVTINGKSYDFQNPSYGNYNLNYVGYGSCCYGWGNSYGRRW